MKRLTALCLLALTLAACDSQNKRTVTGPHTPADFDKQPTTCDSLLQVIQAQEFIIGQQKRMIRCLQSGGTDCFGGI